MWRLAMMVAVLFVLGGCGDSTLSGTYLCKAPNSAGRVEFRKDATFTSVVTAGPGAGQSVTGKYKLEGKRFQLCNPVGQCIAGTINGKQLLFDDRRQGVCEPV